MILFIRNLCDEGNTVGFRPNAARPSPWAFAGAEKYYPPMSKARDRWKSGQTGVGSFPSPDEWLEKLKADTIVGFFGFNESFGGAEKVDAFKDELRDYIKHLRAQKYDGRAAPQLAFVSPTAFEDLSATRGTPDGVKENKNLALYTAAMKEVSEEEGILFVDIFEVTKKWIAEGGKPLTRDGVTPLEATYRRLAPVLANGLFGKKAAKGNASEVLAAVQEKNWMWHKYYKIPNGVHVYGRRYKPYGPGNYPDELEKLEELTAVRDQAIWAALRGSSFDLAREDAKTHRLPKVESNYKPSKKNGSTEYLYGDEALATMTVPEGYKIELFASEREFDDLANPVQMSFDNRGRLWVATMPSYPHYRPGDAKPNDKLIILEDTNGDGKADKHTVFADRLHLPTGFEFAPEGVYVAQGTYLILLKDTDGDDKADEREIVLSGFSDHDTHHAISAFCADPSGAFFMGEGTFLHSNVETAYGPIRSSNGGFFRFDPNSQRLERTARLSIPNPWGIAFDHWGQPFFIDTSDPNLRWMTPGTLKEPYGEFAPLPPSIIEDEQRVRPTAGLEFVSSRHFPDEVQGDILVQNTIGFLGIKQHQLVDDESGFKGLFRQDLLVSSDGNFRPSDLEFAPDGSLYVLDWHNVLIGHMQHSARDPLRDHVHGRVYRITYPERPLVKPVQVAGAPVEALLDNLKVPEDRVRYRTRRELRGRPEAEVMPALKTWVAEATDEHDLLEALWVSWGIDAVDTDLLKRLLKADDFRVRAAAVYVLRYVGAKVPEQAALLAEAAKDENGRVRLEAITAGSWLPEDEAIEVIEAAGSEPMDSWIKPVYKSARARALGIEVEEDPEDTLAAPTKPLDAAAMALYKKGAEVYSREGHCATCHQEDGKGLPAAMFPPLTGTKWVQGNEERLIKIALNGLMGPIEILGKKYPGQVPMTQFKGLSDEELASVLTYVRNTFGNSASPISPEKVKAVRAATADFQGFYAPADLLLEHPHDEP